MYRQHSCTYMVNIKFLVTPSESGKIEGGYKIPPTLLTPKKSAKYTNKMMLLFELVTWPFLCVFQTRIVVDGITEFVAVLMNLRIWWWNSTLSRPPLAKTDGFDNWVCTRWRDQSSITPEFTISGRVPLKDFFCLMMMTTVPCWEQGLFSYLNVMLCKARFELFANMG